MAVVVAAAGGEVQRRGDAKDMHGVDGVEGVDDVEGVNGVVAVVGVGVVPIAAATADAASTMPLPQPVAHKGRSQSVALSWGNALGCGVGAGRDC